MVGGIYIFIDFYYVGWSCLIVRWCVKVWVYFVVIVVKGVEYIF